MILSIQYIGVKIYETDQNSIYKTIFKFYKKNQYSYLILPIAKGRIHSLDARSNFHRSFSVVLVAVHPPNTYRHFS